MRTRDTTRTLNPFLTRSRARREPINASSFLTSNLLWWIRPGTGNGATTWPDSTGNGFNGLVTAAAWGWDAPGYIQSLNGSSQYVEVTDNATLRLTGNVTVSCLVLFNSIPVGGQYPSLCQKATDFTGYGIDFNGDSQLIEFIIGNGVNNWVRATIGPPSTGRWVVYTGVYDGLTMKLYRDGHQVASTASSQNPPTNTAAIVMGRHYSSGIYGWLNGKIGAGAIWNRALSAGEVYSHSKLWLPYP